MNYFQPDPEPKGHLKHWICAVRRRLRAMLWRRQEKAKREARLFALGLMPSGPGESSVNGHGPWGNAGAQHLFRHCPYFTQLRTGLAGGHPPASPRFLNRRMREPHVPVV